MRIAIVTFEGFNELDSFIGSGMLNRVKPPELKALVVCPAERVTSMNGVVIHAQAPLSFAREAEAVIMGSGIHTREIARSSNLVTEPRLDPAPQVIGGQCSGALIVAKRGLLRDGPACTGTKTKPWVEEAGVKVPDQPFVAHGNAATAGGCPGSHYLAAWIIARLTGRKAAESVVHSVAPVGQKGEYVQRALAVLKQYLPRQAHAAVRQRVRQRTLASPALRALARADQWGRQAE